MLSKDLHRESTSMATFYLLPSRPLLNQRFKEFADRLLPGLSPSGDADFVALLHDMMREQPDTYLVHREDLPYDENPVQALIDGFGAETGDEILEIRCEANPDATLIRMRSASDAA
jgi:hypothetical protein